MLKKVVLSFVLFAGIASMTFAQDSNAKKFVGIWKGILDLQGQSITVIFTFQEKDGKITGTAESPEQGGGAIALDNLIIKENKIQFEIAPVRGGYEGTLKEEKKTIEGTIVVQEQAFQLNVTKDEKASAETEKKFSSIWEGKLNAMGTELRLVLKVYTKEDGTLGGFIDSPDQGASNIPTGVVTLTEEILKFDLPAAQGATFEGKIDKETMTAKGTFSQGGGEFPLEMKKVDKPTEKK